MVNTSSTLRPTDVDGETLGGDVTPRTEPVIVANAGTTICTEMMVPATTGNSIPTAGS